MIGSVSPMSSPLLPLETVDFNNNLIKIDGQYVISTLERIEKTIINYLSTRNLDEFERTKICHNIEQQSSSILSQYIRHYDKSFSYVKKLYYKQPQEAATVHQRIHYLVHPPQVFAMLSWYEALYTATYLPICDLTTFATLNRCGQKYAIKALMRRARILQIDTKDFSEVTKILHVQCRKIVFIHKVHLPIELLTDNISKNKKINFERLFTNLFTASTEDVFKICSSWGLYTLENGDPYQMLFKAQPDTTVYDIPNELVLLQGTTALIHAATTGNLHIVTLLLQRHANPNRLKFGSDYPLHCATEGGYIQIMELLLAHGAHVNAKNGNGCTALMIAGRRLVHQMHSISHLTGTKEYASQHKLYVSQYEEIVSLLLKSNADPTLPDNKNHYPLHDAAIGQCIQGMSLLIDKGADINAQNARGATALTSALTFTHSQRAEVVQFLLQHQADPNLPTNSGTSPLHLVTTAGEIILMKLLLEGGAHVDAQNNKGETALMAALHTQMEPSLLYRVLNVLFFYHANPNLPMSNGDFPLHVAADRGNISVMELLLSQGAHISVHNSRQQTPLFLLHQAGRNLRIKEEKEEKENRLNKMRTELLRRVHSYGDY